MKVAFLGSFKRIRIDVPPLEEVSSESASIVYDLRTMREEGRRTEGRGGGGMLVSLVVRFKLRIHLARF